MKSNFNQLAAQRRSIYALGKNVTATPEEIYQLVTTAVRNSPSAFNSQPVRAVVLFNQASNQVWEIVAEALAKVVTDPAAFEQTKQKIASFRAGIGTVLFLTDTASVHKLEEQFPAYADNFADWAEQAIGGSQQAVWTALAEQGIGASLQHYNPLIDDAIHQAFDLPADWQLRAEMPFGSIEGLAGDKEYLEEKQVFKLIK